MPLLPVRSAGLHPRVSWLLLPIVAWVLWAAMIFLAQRRMLFPGRAPIELRENAFRGATLHRIQVPGGEVEAWWLPAAGGAERPAPAVLFFHGNYELVDEWVDGFEPLRAAGAGVLLVEFPGYGRSTGVATQTSVTAAALAAFDLVAAKAGEVDPTRIVALGRSVGGGPASALALERPVAALALSSAFTSVRAYARGYFMPGFLVRHPFDNESAVRAFGGPVLVQHGTGDRTVPFVHGERLSEAARDGRFVPYECGHNDCPWDEMLADLIAFLAERGILGNPRPANGVG